MEVSVGENPVHPATDRAQLGHTALLHPTVELKNDRVEVSELNPDLMDPNPSQYSLTGSQKRNVVF
jgi:hypothetical protein